MRNDPRGARPGQGDLLTIHRWEGFFLPAAGPRSNRYRQHGGVAPAAPPEGGLELTRAGRYADGI